MADLETFRLAQEMAWASVAPSELATMAILGDSTVAFGPQLLFGEGEDCWQGRWPRADPDYTMWKDLGVEVVSDSGARLVSRKDWWTQRTIVGFHEQLDALPKGSSVLLVGGWNDRNSDPEVIRAGLQVLKARAAEKNLKAVRVSLRQAGEPYTDWLEELYADALGWPVVESFAEIYSSLAPSSYWQQRNEGWAFNDADLHHRVWTPCAARRLVGLARSIADSRSC